MSDINAILDRHGIKRCGDSSCIFGPRGGMMTNGGCRCGHDDPERIAARNLATAHHPHRSLAS